MSAVMRLSMVMFCGGAGVSGLTMPVRPAKARHGVHPLGMLFDRPTALLHGILHGQDQWGKTTSPPSPYIYARETHGRDIDPCGSVVMSGCVPVLYYSYLTYVATW